MKLKEFCLFLKLILGIITMIAFFAKGDYELMAWICLLMWTLIGAFKLINFAGDHNYD